jgi:CBS domain-containing protein
MAKAFEVMTRSLVTCAPDARVTDVAATMRDRNIGVVLILRDGKLHGIVTDRDLAIHAFTGKDDPLQDPISKYMSAPVVTGEAERSLERVSEVMARHQIRRLPIVEDGQLAGIVSLGEVALHADKKQAVAKSLQAVSEPAPESVRLGRGRVLTALALAASATMVSAMLAVNHAAQGWRKNGREGRVEPYGAAAAELGPRPDGRGCAA